MLPGIQGSEENQNEKQIVREKLNSLKGSELQTKSIDLLYTAIKNKQYEVCEMLLAEYKMNPNKGRDAWLLPLDVAIENHDGKMVEFLLNYNAEPLLSLITNAIQLAIKS